MPGNYKPSIIFPFYFEEAKSARIQIEPFSCIRCYGMNIRVILQLVGGSGDNRFEYERVAIEENITQENIKEGFMSAPFIEVMEGFYYNKTEVNILIPVCAMLLKIYFKDLLDAFGIDLSEFVVDVVYSQEEIGFKTNSNVSNRPTNKLSYKEAEAVSPYSNTGNDEAENKLTCKQIVKALQRTSKGQKC